MFGSPRNYIPFSLCLSSSASIYVIGAAVELPWWFRWEQFEKIGWEKAQNNSYEFAEVLLATDDGEYICLPVSSPWTQRADVKQIQPEPWIHASCGIWEIPLRN